MLISMKSGARGDNMGQELFYTLYVSRNLGREVAAVSDHIILE
jgi:hypothetical protein